MMKVIWLVPVALCGQTLQIQSEPAVPGHAGTAVMWLDSPSGKEPLALQWELDLATTALQLAFKNVLAGDTAKAAGKSIGCSLVARERRDRFRYRCILAGGVNAIANGPVAMLQYSAARGGKPGRYPLHLRNGLSVGRSLKKDRLKDSEVALSLNN